jgi:hypothetical protein
MSPRREPARPIEKITLKIALEGEGPSMARASKTMKRSKLSRDGLVIVSRTNGPAEAIEEMERFREATKRAKDAPKDFK